MVGMDRSEAGRLGYLKTQAAMEASQQRRHDEAVARYADALKHCRQCGELLPYEKRHSTFCDRTCSAKFNNAKRASKKKCLGCGGPLPRPSYTYCSTRCQHTTKHRELDALVLASGNVNPHYKAPVATKKFLLRHREHQCELCGGAEWRGHPMPLVMDHINGDASDNRLVNLRLVCGNCDMQIPTYKAKNKGNGRHSRRKRYAEGKSY